MQHSPIRYRVSMENRQAHEFQIQLTLPPIPQSDSVTLSFPAWAPGSYLIRDFSRHIYDLQFSVGGKAIQAERLDKLSWRVPSKGKSLKVHYRVFAFETSVRTSFLDESHAFWNGANLFFQVMEAPQAPYEVQVVAPRGWQISTPLSAQSAGRYWAQNFDELVDSPFEIGTHARHYFRVEKSDFEVAIYGRTNADIPRLLSDLEAIVRATGQVFQGFPFKYYLFIIHALPSRGGGLEHANACTLDIAGHGFEDEKAYQSFAELAAHEFFHTWNVKRIRDRILGPFDYTRENYTRLLWFHEGFTEYMQTHILLRAGRLTREKYLQDLAEAWEKYVDRPGRNNTPLSELSFEAWIKQYKPAENHMNRMVSYYEKGKWAAVVLDLWLLHSTQGRQGLFALFRRLWKNQASQGISIDEGILKQEIFAMGGTWVHRFFHRYIHGTDELPVLRMLQKTGIQTKAEPQGTKERKDPTRQKRMAGYTGLTLLGSGPSQGALVKNVVPLSPAFHAGITYGDEIVALDGIRVTQQTAIPRFADHPPGDRVSVSFFRQDILRECTIRISDNPLRTFRFTQNPTAPRGQQLLRRKWLG